MSFFHSFFQNKRCKDKKRQIAMKQQMQAAEKVSESVHFSPHPSFSSSLLTSLAHKKNARRYGPIERPNYRISPVR